MNPPRTLQARDVLSTIRANLVLISYGSAGFYALLLCFMVLDLSDVASVLIVIVAVFMVVPALLLALLTWQVSTGESANLGELVTAGFMAFGQTLFSLSILFFGLFGEETFTTVVVGLLGTPLGILLGIFTCLGLLARSRSLNRGLIGTR